jgi:curved DNA-binding protein
MEFKDYYKILGIHQGSDAGEIKNAYRRMVNLHHPDKHPENERDAAPFIEIQEAYDILGDHEKRREYDRLYENEQRVTPDRPEKFEGSSGNFSRHGYYADNAIREFFRSFFKGSPERKRPSGKFGNSSNHIHYDDLL